VRREFENCRFAWCVHVSARNSALLLRPPVVSSAFYFLLEPQPEPSWGPERVLVDRAERNTPLSAVILAVSDKLLCHLINEEAIRQYWEEELAKAGLSLRSDIPGKGVICASAPPNTVEAKTQAAPLAPHGSVRRARTQARSFG
jgi:hypothetical protein